MGQTFPNLFSSIKLGNCDIKNRVVSTGHHTYLADREPNDSLIAYHAARAKGGAGLIVSEVIAVHETAAFSSQLLTIDEATDLQAYQRLADACHEYGCKLFAQLFHPGREILSTKSGFSPIAYAPSAVANERFHILPKPMSVKMINEIIDGFGRCAGVLEKAGYDGVEIVGSHGYLPAQFLSPAVNLREDEFGGDFERRLTFVQQCIRSIRQQAPTLAIGLRLSANDYEPEGLDESAVGEICALLDDEVDYFSLVAGSSATLGASVHISAPMGIDAGYLAPASEAVKRRITKPVIVTGRINQPQEAEKIIASGQADLCGMTRAMISDAEMPNKAFAGQSDDIRACIACNQSCIGRAHKGLSISCLQNPQSGRETMFSDIEKVKSDKEESSKQTSSKQTSSKQVMVIGGGPAGMKAALTAAQCGHRVKLYEKTSQLGGQALIAQRLPGREEFGGLVTNLVHELEQSSVEIIKNSDVSAEMVIKQNPDRVILATGGHCFMPELEMLDGSMVVSYEDILLERTKSGKRVIVADWRGDWIGLGLAEKLARDGCQVSLYVNASMAGESLQIYTRNHYVARLHKLGVEVVPHARLFGADDGVVYFQNSLSDEAIVVEDIDTLVLSMGLRPENALEQALESASIRVTCIGDCLVPRSAEEAIYEGYVTSREIT